MRALLSKAPGGADTLVLEEIDEPAPSADEVLLEVHACGLNFPDTLLLTDQYQHRPARPFAPGGEVAGYVLSVGRRVTALKAGDRVLAMVGFGGLAERVVTPASKCVIIPDEMSFDDAAVLMGTFGTAYHGLKQRGRLKAGETLFVLGAAGGIGLASVQLGCALGANVFAAASCEDKLELARRNGATGGVVYPTTAMDKDRKELARLFKSISPEGGMDVIVDPVGGVYAVAALRTMAWRGRYLVVGFTAGIPTIALNIPLLKGCEVSGVFYGRFTEEEPVVNAKNANELLQLYADGKIRPYISTRLVLEDAAVGYELLSSRRAQGKIVVSVKA